MRILTLLFRLLFILAVTAQTSVSQVCKDQGRVSQRKNVRLTFEGAVLYNIEDISRGLEDIWRASMRLRNEMPRENLGLFTTKGLLVLPNTGNKQFSVLGSLKFLNININNEHTKVAFKGEELEILGMIHTHPDALGVREHSPFERTSFEWQWTTGKIGNYVIAIDGIYRAERDYLTSKWIGYRQEKTYQLIVSRYHGLTKANREPAE